MTKSDFIYALKTCGCLYHNEQIYYEENELIRTFEDLEMLEEEKALSQEPTVDVLEQIRNEIGKAWHIRPKNKYEEGLKDQALKDMEIIDKYKGE